MTWARDCCLSRNRPANDDSVSHRQPFPDNPGEPELESIIGTVYDDSDLACEPGGDANDYYDPLGCGFPWPWWCVLAVNEREEALLVPLVMEPLLRITD